MRVLVIGNRSFEHGFKVLGSINYSVDYYYRNEWRKLRLLRRLSLICQYDIIHYFWARVSWLEVLIALLFLRKRIIQHYIGSDALFTLSSIRKIYIQRILIKLSVICCACSDNISEELQDNNIRCRTLHFVNRKLEDNYIGYPSKLKVLCDLPQGKEDFYGLESILYCARKMPDTEFYILRNTNNYSLPNVEPLGDIRWNCMIDLYNRYSVYVRMTKHDSLSTSILEALSCGRHVVWSYPFPHCHQATSKEELFDLLSKQSLFSEPNTCGKDHVLEHYSIDALKHQYETLWSHKRFKPNQI